MPLRLDEYPYHQVTASFASVAETDLTTNLIVDVDEDAGTATAQSYITALQALPDFPLQPIFVGRYRDRFTRVGNGWRWIRREVIADLYGDASHHVRSPASPGGK
jgi:hypothetical protein